LAGGYPTSPCFPVPGLFVRAELRQKQSIDTGRPTPIPVAQAQGVDRVFPLTGRIDQAQAITASLENFIAQAQSVHTAGLVIGIDQAQGLVVAVGGYAIDQAQAVWWFTGGAGLAAIDQAQAVVRQLPAAIDQAQAVVRQLPAAIDQKQNLSGIPYTVRCTNVPGATHQAALKWTVVVAGFTGADAHLNGTWNIAETAACAWQDGAATWTINVNPPQTNLYANTTYGLVFYQLNLAAWSPMAANVYPYGFGGPPSRPASLTPVPVGL